MWRWRRRMAQTFHCNVGHRIRRTSDHREHMASLQRACRCRHAAIAQNELRWQRCSFAGWRMPRDQRPDYEKTIFGLVSRFSKQFDGIYLWIFQFRISVDASIADASIQTIHNHGKLHCWWSKCQNNVQASANIKSTYKLSTDEERLQRRPSYVDPTT